MSNCNVCYQRLTAKEASGRSGPRQTVLRCDQCGAPSRLAQAIAAFVANENLATPDSLPPLPKALPPTQPLKDLPNLTVLLKRASRRPASVPAVHRLVPRHHGTTIVGLPQVRDALDYVRRARGILESQWPPTAPSMSPSRSGTR